MKSTRDFLASLGSLYWWLSVVLIGILINLASAVIKSRLDSTLSRASTKWRLRSEADRVKREKALNSLFGNFTEQILLSNMALRDQTLAVLFLVLSILFLVVDIHMTVTPIDNFAWWPFSPPTVVGGLRTALSLFAKFGFSLCAIMCVRSIMDSRYKHKLVHDSLRLAPHRSSVKT